MADPALSVDGFLCPGHVSTIIGTRAYHFIAEAGRAAVITGIEPVDILEGAAWFPPRAPAPPTTNTREGEAQSSHPPVR
jgi:hypothetical protein